MNRSNNNNNKSFSLSSPSSFFLVSILLVLINVSSNRCEVSFSEPQGQTDVILIDDFSSGSDEQGFLTFVNPSVILPMTQTDIWPGDRTSASVANIFGGERDLRFVFEESGGSGFLASKINMDQTTGNAFWSLSGSFSSSGKSAIQWDGNDGDAILLSPTGLGPMDFTDEGNNQHLHLEIACDLNTTLTITIASPGGSCSYQYIVQGNTDIELGLELFSLWIPFEDLSSTGTCDLTQVGGLEIMVNQDRNVDAALFLVAISGSDGTIPRPAGNSQMPEPIQRWVFGNKIDTNDRIEE